MAETMKRSRANARRLTDDEIDAQIPVARAREELARTAGLRAKAARYDAGSRRIVLELTNGIGFAFPARFVRGLERATSAQRAQVTLSPSGSGVLWEKLDADISVAGLLASTFGRGIAASALGRAGGQARSSAKSLAAKANGAKGGRPKKLVSGIARRREKL